MSMGVNRVWSAQCTLGEGVTWDARSGTVLFVDIHGKRVFGLDLKSGRQSIWSAPERIGWLIARQGGGWVAGLQSGFAEVELGDAGRVDVVRWLAQPFAHRPSLRLNDAKADAQGRIWAGSLDNDAEGEPHGSLWRLDATGDLLEVDQGYCVANGPALSPDGRLMLHTDSVRKTIYAFDVDAATGTLSGKRVWMQLAEDEGYPDGMNFDAEGCLWMAHWGASCVSRWSASGDLLSRVALPASHVTNVAFGGERLDRLFVTTARAGLSADRLAAEPDAGALFEITGHGTCGLPPMTFRG